MKIFSSESLVYGERVGFCISQMNEAPHRPVGDDHVIGIRWKHGNM